LVILAVQFLEIALDALLDPLKECRELVWSEVARFGVDRFELAAVDGDEFTPEEVQLFAQQRELSADLSQRYQIVLPEVCHRLVIRPALL
jgi:hypothetical protein